MKVRIDKEADAMYVRLSEGAIEDTKEVGDGVLFDYDEDGNVVGIEVLYLSRRAQGDAEEAFALEVE
jgi:uncharacterized protein YuzE